MPERGVRRWPGRLSGLRGKGCCAMRCCRLQLLRGVLAERARIFGAPARRGARHGRLRHLPGRHDGALPARHAAGRCTSRTRIAGLANRVLARVADRVLSGFPERARQGAARSWYGNPVRREIARDCRRRRSAMPAARPAAPARRRRQPRCAGAERARARGAGADCRRASARASRTRRARSTSTRCAGAYAAAGVKAEAWSLHRRHGGSATPRPIWSICRAGAMTVAELAAAGVGERARAVSASPWTITRRATRSLLADAARRCCCRKRELTAGAAGAALLRSGRPRAALSTMAERARAPWARPDATRTRSRACMDARGDGAR